MARFLIRSVISTIVTMLLVSAILFILLEVSGRDVTRQILGAFATPEQRDSLRNQLGLDEPAWQRYGDWLFGNARRASNLIGHPVETLTNPQSGEQEW
ncbi:MAG: hypothetical protein KDE51_16550, partial [Anaerolineales bacterium]|nr:hypothetical protein [Anaerolineales bacterium]